MKRLAFLLVYFSFCLLGSAQINLQDSTVQVVAYWDLGEKHKYSYQSQEYEVQGQDTIWGDFHSSDFTLEVLDSTANSYVVECRVLEYENHCTDSLEQRVVDFVASITSNIPIRYQTNELGQFQDFVNWEEQCHVIDSIIPLVNDMMIEDMPELKTIPEDTLAMLKNVVTHMMSVLKNKSTMVASYKELFYPLYYHGAKLQLDKRYESAQKFSSPWLPNDVIDGSLEFEVARYNPETNWVTFHLTKSWNTDMLLESFLRYMKQVIPDMEDNNLQDSYVFAESFFELAVHVTSGWPGYAFERVVTQTGKNQKVEEWEVELVFE